MRVSGHLPYRVSEFLPTPTPVMKVAMMIGIMSGFEC